MFKNVRYLSLLPLLLHVVLAVIPIAPASNAVQGPNRHLIENELPKADQTHEVAMLPNSNIVLISQLSNSVLLKTEVDGIGAVQKIAAFQIGQATSRLHGVTNSMLYPGKVWLTLQEDSKLLLIDPVASSLQEAPIILKEIDVPKEDGAKGPHYITEYDNDLWVSLQDSSHILRINPEKPNDYKLFKTIPRPVFVVKHPVNSNIYSGLDNNSTIAKIESSGQVKFFPLPSDVGQTPVGMIAGAEGVWFAILGNATHGTGTIGFIDSNDNFTYHKLQKPAGKSASLLHLVFDTDYEKSHVIWVLSSSIVKNDAVDMLIKVTFDPQWNTIVDEDYITLPTQMSKAHRIFVTPKVVYVTELASSRMVAYLRP